MITSFIRIIHSKDSMSSLLIVKHFELTTYGYGALQNKYTIIIIIIRDSRIKRSHTIHNKIETTIVFTDSKKRLPGVETELVRDTLFDVLAGQRLIDLKDGPQMWPTSQCEHQVEDIVVCASILTLARLSRKRMRVRSWTRRR